MDLESRIGILSELADFMNSDDPAWTLARQRAQAANPWFIPAFTDLAIKQITDKFLSAPLLREWVEPYGLNEKERTSKNVGVVMAGNIPLVGFHDFLSVFISGHRQTIKYSSKDNQLLPALVAFIHGRYPETKELITSAEMLKGCDAFIATGSNNTSRYFDYYFGKYPSLIRRNRTSIAVVDGRETDRELGRLADDICLYFGQGCRNVSQLLVPEGYDFVPLIDALNKYDWFDQENRYKNNYDYQLSIAILNKRYYMTNGSVLLMENESPFSPVSTLHYRYSTDPEETVLSLAPQLQCVAGRDYLPFGTTQFPGLADYADAADTLQFLRDLV